MLRPDGHQSRDGGRARRPGDELQRELLRHLGEALVPPGRGLQDHRLHAEERHMIGLEGMDNGPLAESRGGRIYGVAVGVVTNNKDPDKLGRIKVKFPWLSDTDE